MPVAMINLGDSEATVKIKILNILTYHGISTSGITSWGVARSRLNEAANLVLLPEVEAEDGVDVRAAINAISQSIAAADPINTIIPVITGTAALGQILSISNGTWTGYPSPTYTYQWKRGGVDILGATDNTYTLVTADIGQVITASVTATNTGGSTVATSNGTANVVASPVNTAIPVISGVAAVGQILTTTNGTWTGYPVPTYTYQWKADGVNIGGATNNNYTLTVSELGKVITVAVTATNSQGNTTANSDATVNVVSAPVNTAIPVISGSAISGQTLSTTNGTWNAYPVPTYTYQWKSDGVNIGGATSNTFLLTDTQAGTNITVTVTATNSEGSNAATSSMTAIVKPSWMTENLNLFADFINDHFWNDDIVTSAIVTDTHSQSILVPDGSGGWVVRGANVLSTGPSGLQAIPTRTNQLYPSSVFDALWTKPAQLTVTGTVNDTTATVNADFTGFLTFERSGITNLFPASTQWVYSIDLHNSGLAMLSLWNSVDGYIAQFNAATGVATGTGTSMVALGGGWYRCQVTKTQGVTAAAATRIKPGTNSSQAYTTGQFARFRYPQIEYGTSFAGPPIITTTTVATRNANIPRISGLTSQLATGVAGFIKFDELVASQSGRILMIQDNEDNQIRIDVSGGNTRLVVQLPGSVFPAILTIGPSVTGMQKIAFVVTTDFFAVRRVGSTQQTDTLGAYPTGMQYVDFNHGLGHYHMESKIGLSFTGPFNQAKMDEMYAIASAA